MLDDNLKLTEQRIAKFEDRLEKSDDFLKPDIHDKRIQDLLHTMHLDMMNVTEKVMIIHELYLSMSEQRKLMRRQTDVIFVLSRVKKDVRLKVGIH